VVAFGSVGLERAQAGSGDAVKGQRRITDAECQLIAGVVMPTVTRNLKLLARSGALERKGTTGRDVYYVLMAQKGLKGFSMDSKTALEGREGPKKAGKEGEA